MLLLYPSSNIFIQLLQTTSPRPSHAHLLVAACTTPTSYFLARRQKISDGFIESTALWHESLHNNANESASRRRSRTYTGFLSSTSSTSRWQHSCTRFYNVTVVNNQHWCSSSCASFVSRQSQTNCSQVQNQNCFSGFQTFWFHI